MAGCLQMLTIRCFDDTYVELLDVPLLPCPDLPAAWTSRGVHIDIPHFATQNPTLNLKPVIYSDRLISLARFCHSEYYQSGCKEIAVRKSHPTALCAQPLSTACPLGPCSQPLCAKFCRSSRYCPSVPLLDHVGFNDLVRCNCRSR